MKLRKQDVIDAADKFVALVKQRYYSKTRQQWAFILGSIATGILFFVLFMDLVIMPLYLRAGQEVIVPDLIGQKWMDGYHLARKHQLLLARDGISYSETIPRNQIATQHPVPGSLVKPGRRVHITISSGSEKIKVPDLLGERTSEAEDMIRNSGLAIGDKLKKKSRNVPSGRVMHQSPKAGTEVRPGTVVNMQIAR